MCLKKYWETCSHSKVWLQALDWLITWLVTVQYDLLFARVFCLGCFQQREVSGDKVGCNLRLEK